MIRKIKNAHLEFDVSFSCTQISSKLWRWAPSRRWNLSCQWYTCWKTSPTFFRSPILIPYLKDQAKWSQKHLYPLSKWKFKLYCPRNWASSNTRVYSFCAPISLFTKFSKNNSRFGNFLDFSYRPSSELISDI